MSRSFKSKLEEAVAQSVVVLLLIGLLFFIAMPLAPASMDLKLCDYFMERMGPGWKGFAEGLGLFLGVRLVIVGILLILLTIMFWPWEKKR